MVNTIVQGIGSKLTDDTVDVRKIFISNYFIYGKLLKYVW